MPREIADSDDEFDLAPTPSKPTATATSNGTVYVEQIVRPGVEDPVLDIDFDTFCSPTQRLSSFDAKNDDTVELNTSNLLDSSTNRFLNEVAPADSSDLSDDSPTQMGGKKADASRKRSRSRVAEGDNTAPSKEARSTRKKTKAYGSSGTRSTMSVAALDFQNVINNSANTNGTDLHLPGTTDVVDTENLISIEPRSDYTPTLDLSLHFSPPDGVVVDATKEGNTTSGLRHTIYIPSQPYTPQASFIGNEWGGGTISHSSIGNHQSFSINPSALGMGYEDFNPFGRPDKKSGGGEEVEHAREHDALTGISSKTPSNQSTMLPLTVDMGVIQEMETSPLKMDSVTPPEKLVAEEEPPHGSPPFSPITNPDDQHPGIEAALSPQNLDVAVEDRERHVAESMKPQPKKRGRKPKPKKPEEIDRGNSGVNDEAHLDDHLSDRRVRAATVDSVSNMSEVSQATTTSNNGRKKKPKPKKSDLAPLEVLSKKLPSSDLGLDNKAVIGLSPERYVPRPSRRRGHVEPELPSLPDIPVEAEAQTNRAGKRKGKKTKVAAAVAVDDNSEQEGEGEEVESKIPAIPRHGPLAESVDIDLSETGVGVKSAKQQANDGEGEDDVLGAGHRAKITVDVPVLIKLDDHEELPVPVPEPKKRGRKRKKPTEDSVIHEEPVQESPHDDRPALAEKSLNAQPKKSQPSQSLAQIVDEENDEDDLAKTTQEETNMKQLKSVASKTELVSHPTTPKSIFSPVKPLSSASFFNTKARIGLSNRRSIPSLLRKVNRDKEAPKAIVRKEKLSKHQLEEKEAERIAKEEAEAEGREYVRPDLLRGKDGMLVEWDF